MIAFAIIMLSNVIGNGIIRNAYLPTASTAVVAATTFFVRIFSMLQKNSFFTQAKNHKWALKLRPFYRTI